MIPRYRLSEVVSYPSYKSSSRTAPWKEYVRRSGGFKFLSCDSELVFLPFGRIDADLFFYSSLKVANRVPVSASASLPGYFFQLIVRRTSFVFLPVWSDRTRVPSVWSDRC